MKINYSTMVRTLFKPGKELLAEMTSYRVNLMHAAAGISGEAGELLDAIKKNWAYNKPLDRKNVIEELGDMEFYMEALRQEIGITREETITANINKLSKRYEGFVFSNEAAQARRDKLTVDANGDLDIRYGEG